MFQANGTTPECGKVDVKSYGGLTVLKKHIIVSGGNRNDSSLFTFSTTDGSQQNTIEVPLQAFSISVRFGNKKERIPGTFVCGVQGFEVGNTFAADREKC